MSKALLFDFYGVLTLPEEMFSTTYARMRGFDVDPLEEFFRNEWQEYVTGRKDLKQYIEDNLHLLKWDGSAEEFLDYWFELEDVKNEPLLDAIRDCRKMGIPCYIATEQEKYRTEYIRTRMFSDDFDGIFSTAEIGMQKNDPRFFEAIIKSLGVDPADVVYFDDSRSRLDAASQAGIQAHLYGSVLEAVEIIQENVSSVAKIGHGNNV